jgi:hypothetical protein
MLKCIASASKNENYLQFSLVNLTINSILNPHCLYNYTILGSKCTSYKTTYTKKCLNFNFFHTLKYINVNFLWISKRRKQSYKATRALCIYRYLVYKALLWKIASLFVSSPSKPHWSCLRSGVSCIVKSRSYFVPFAESEHSTGNQHQEYREAVFVLLMNV